jgi:hypothetical protein
MSGTSEKGAWTNFFGEEAFRPFEDVFTETQENGKKNWLKAK